MTGLRLLVSGLWFLFMLWMLTYEMYISFVYSSAMLWVFLPSAQKDKKKSWKAPAILLFSPIVIWNIGLVEYGLKTIDLHCRVLGYFSDTGKVTKPAFCSIRPDAYAQGKRHTDGPLFTTVEHIGVHGFNVLVATGGFVAGLPEVAWETLYMSFAEDPVESGIVNEPKKIRQKQCMGGKSAQKKSSSRGRGDWMLTSKTVRQLVAKNVKRASKVSPGNPKTFSKKTLAFKTEGKHGNSDNGYYGELLRTDNLRVPLTLVVPDGTIHQEAYASSDGPVIDVMWKGTISYPPNAQFKFDIPTIYQLPFLQPYTGQTKPFPLLISEGMFCGMTLDGAMNVYTQEWHTTVSVDDERLSDTGKLESEQGWIETVLSPILQ